MIWNMEPACETYRDYRSKIEERFIKEFHCTYVCRIYLMSDFSRRKSLSHEKCEYNDPTILELFASIVKK